MRPLMQTPSYEKSVRVPIVLAITLMAPGCVSTGTDEGTVAELQQMKKRLAAAEEQAAAQQKQASNTVAKLDSTTSGLRKRARLLS